MTVDITIYDLVSQPTAESSSFELTSSYVYIEPTSSVLVSINDALWKYVSPFVIAAGVIGNLLILTLMSRDVFKGFDMKPYFNFLAFSDTCILLLGEFTNDYIIKFEAILKAF